MTAARSRLDQALVALSFADSRSQARALIMAGQVRVNGHTAAKAGTLVDPGADIEILEPPRFVGRGGEKLAAALEIADIDPRSRVCLDIGASTGGFTDCLLQNGAAQVIAVDVGYGQLDWKLRQDERVVVMERVNARYLSTDDLPEEIVASPDLLVVDVSFIGLGKVLPAVTAVCAPEAEALVLVKPQFECGPDSVAPGGVVGAAADRRTALATVGADAAQTGWRVRAAIPSLIRGAAGNWECFLYLSRQHRGGETASLDVLLDSVAIPEG